MVRLRTGVLKKLEQLRQEERDGINWSDGLDIVVDDAKQVA